MRRKTMPKAISPELATIIVTPRTKSRSSRTQSSTSQTENRNASENGSFEQVPAPVKIAEIQDKSNKKRATEENKKTVTKERRQMSTQDKRRASWQKVKDGQRSIETKNQFGKKQKQVQRKRNRY